MDKKLGETTNLHCMCRNNEQQTTCNGENWSRGTNLCLLFDVNVMLNLFIA